MCPGWHGDSETTEMRLPAAGRMAVVPTKPHSTSQMFMEGTGIVP